VTGPLERPVGAAAYASLRFPGPRPQRPEVLPKAPARSGRNEEVAAVAADQVRMTVTPAAEERLAGRLAAQQPRGSGMARAEAVKALTELGQIDRAVYRAVAGTPTPVLDPPTRRLSTVADRSKLWLGIAAVMAAAGGPDGRRAAGAGLVAIAVDSAVVNVGFKFAARRRRPDREAAGVPVLREVPMPHSTSFPSGHAASAFAFANAVGQSLPMAAVPLRLLASAVGYSRVHTGVHYPGDVVLGAVIGASIGDLVGWWLARRGRTGAQAR
jgi:membrane-associated phospholipid phosphatase